MKTFDVYKHPALGYQAVKQGVSWPAFFFLAFWAFVKKMWGLGFALLGVLLLLALVDIVFEEQGGEGGMLIMLLVRFAFYIGVGVKGNDWRRQHLQKHGFEKLRAVRAETPDAAIGEVAKFSDE